MTDINMKKSIIVSVVSSILVLIFIKPLLNLGWRFLTWCSNNFYHNFLNNVYGNAALGQRDWVSVILFFIVVSVMLGIFTGILTLPLFRKLRKIKEKRGDKAFRNIRRIFLCLRYILSIVIIFLLICMIISIYADLQLNTSFQQRLRVLSPRIGDLETKNLQASWALMELKEDYEKIVRRMEELAKENNIELPKLLIN